MGLVKNRIVEFCSINKLSPYATLNSQMLDSFQTLEVLIFIEQLSDSVANYNDINWDNSLMQILENLNAEE